MNIIFRWAASRLLEDWTETTWWADAVLPEFERDIANDRHEGSELTAPPIEPPDELT